MITAHGFAAKQCLSPPSLIIACLAVSSILKPIAKIQSFFHRSGLWSISNISKNARLTVAGRVFPLRGIAQK
jgi:hypothetical protein